MKRKLISLLLAVALLASQAAGLAADNRVLVFIEEGAGFTVQENGLRVAPGEDATFTLTLDRGAALTGTDYSGEAEIETQGRQTLLTLRAVVYPTRVRLSISTKYCVVTYDANGGEALAGEPVVEKRYGTSAHPRPNTENGAGLFAREGYTLVCWNTRSDGEGECVGLGSRVTPVNGQIRLYAQWAKWNDAADFLWEGDDSATITAYHGQSDILVVPSFLDGRPVRAIAEGAFAGCQAREVVLPEGLKSVENGAFRDSSLEEITLFDSIESVSDAAFAGCDSLRTLHINAAEAPFGYVFRKESVYADKVELLMKAQGRKKLVFYGGCSMWYNLDAEQAAKRFGEEYAIINVALNGTVSSAVQMQIMAPYLEAGDVLFHTPELSSRPQLMLHTAMGDNDSSLWAGLENNYDLFALVDLRTVDGAFDSLTHYLSLKDKRTDYQQFYSDDYRTPYIDRYGSIPFYRSGTEKELGDTVSLDPALVCEEALGTLEAYYGWLGQRGVRIVVSYACVNMDALPEDEHENVEAVDGLFRQAISAMDGPVAISRLSDYLYNRSDYYDTNYHLCSEPAKRNTARWLDDLERWLGDEA